MQHDIYKLATLATLVLSSASLHAAPGGAVDAAEGPAPTEPRSSWYAAVGSGVDFGGRSVGDLQTNPGAAQLGVGLGLELSPSWALQLDAFNVFLPAGVVAKTGVDSTAAWSAVALSYAPWHNAHHRWFVGALGGAEVTATHVAETSKTAVDPLVGLRLGYAHRASEHVSFAIVTDLVPFWNTTVRTQGSVQMHF